MGLSLVIVIQLCLALLLAIKVISGLVEDFLDAVVWLMAASEEVGSPTMRRIHVNCDVLD